jgi:hypothetical protein
MEAPPLDHECPWRDEALALRVVVAEQRQQLDQLGQTLTEEQQKLAQLTLHCRWSQVPVCRPAGPGPGVGG